MYYRSDWPEVGLSAAINESTAGGRGAGARSEAVWDLELRGKNAAIHWIAVRNRFESELYGFPVCECRIETDDVEGPDLSGLCGARLRPVIVAGIDQLLDALPRGAIYLFSRMVRTEPLYPALLELGFEEVEQRRLYRTRVCDLAGREMSSFDGSLRFASLADLAHDQLGPAREEIFQICREVFGEKGHSRHFTDPFLLERLPGIAYITAAMDLNFRRQKPGAFLLALDRETTRVLGFSVVGEKAGLIPGMYTQLLSAVRKEYQGRDIYAGISQLLKKTLPREATLLNVTHEGNSAIQAAYRRSGRVHLADTVVVRRICRAGANSL